MILILIKPATLQGFLQLHNAVADTGDKAMSTDVWLKQQQSRKPEKGKESHYIGNSRQDHPTHQRPVLFCSWFTMWPLLELRNSRIETFLELLKGLFDACLHVLPGICTGLLKFI